jgi:hypothetical protein
VGLIQSKRWGAHFVISKVKKKSHWRFAPVTKQPTFTPIIASAIKSQISWAHWPPTAGRSAEKDID